MYSSSEEFWNKGQFNMDLEPCHNFIQNNYLNQDDSAIASKTLQVNGVGVVTSHNLFQNAYKGALGPSGMYIVTE